MCYSTRTTLISLLTSLASSSSNSRVVPSNPCPEFYVLSSSSSSACHALHRASLGLALSRVVSPPMSPLRIRPEHIARSRIGAVHVCL